MIEVQEKREKSSDENDETFNPPRTSLLRVRTRDFSNAYGGT